MTYIPTSAYEPGFPIEWEGLDYESAKDATLEFQSETVMMACPRHFLSIFCECATPTDSHILH